MTVILHYNEALIDCICMFFCRHWLCYPAHLLPVQDQWPHLQGQEPIYHQVQEEEEEVVQEQGRGRKEKEINRKKTKIPAFKEAAKNEQCNYLRSWFSSLYSIDRCDFACNKMLIKNKNKNRPRLCYANYLRDGACTTTYTE